MIGAAAAGAEDRAARSGRGRRRLLGRRHRARQRLGQPRPLFISLKPLAERGGMTTSARHRPPARQAAGIAGVCACSCSRRRTCASAAGRATRSTSSRCGSPDSRRTHRWAPRVLERIEAVPGHRRRLDRPRAGRTAGQRRDRPASRRRGSASASRTSTTRSTTPSRSGRSRPSTPSATSIASFSKSTRSLSAIRPTSRTSMCRAATAARRCRCRP